MRPVSYLPMWESKVDDHARDMVNVNLDPFSRASKPVAVGKRVAGLTRLSLCWCFPVSEIAIDVRMNHPQFHVC